MIGIVIFSAAQALASGYAAWRGGAPERLVAALLCAAFLATLVVPYDPALDYRSVNLPIACEDLVLATALIAVAVMADRFWPLAIAAIQLNALGLHVVRAFDLTVLPVAYWALSSRLGYIILMFLAVGTARHVARVGRGSAEFSWTFQRHAHERATAQRR